MSDYPVIPELPDPPLRTDGRVDFARKGSVFLGAFPAMRAAFNDAGAWVQTTLATILGYKNAAEQAVSDAEDQVVLAANQVTAAQGYATTAGNRALDAEGAANEASQYAQIAAATANFKGEWGDLTGPLAIPASVYHSGSYWQLLNNLADVTLSEPGVSSDWIGTDTNVQGWSAISTSTVLEKNARYAVTFSSALDLTLPAAPLNNDRVWLYRSGGDATGSTIIRNGNTIMGVAEDMTIDSNITSLTLIFNGSDWRIV